MNENIYNYVIELAEKYTKEAMTEMREEENITDKEFYHWRAIH